MININQVYETVLNLANKEQRGYITPDEFNSFAVLAQREIFESYFIKKFQAAQAPDTTEDYINIDMNIDEKISYFDRFATVASKTTLAGGRSGYAYPDDFYRLDHTSVQGPQGFPIKVDEISHQDSHYVNLSPFTRPTNTQPVMIREEGGVILFPETYTGPLNFFYVRKPVDPVWGFLQNPMMNDGMPVYNAATSTDFELHESEQHHLVYAILALAGVTIKQPDIQSFGQGKEAQLNTTEG